MGTPWIVFDFDGTLTELETDAQAFLERYRDEVASVLKMPFSDIAPLWDNAVATVQSDASRYGWKWENRIVAPGQSDPYILAFCAADLVYDRLGALEQPLERMWVSQNLFHTCYNAFQPRFKPEASSVLDALIAKGIPVAVVSNSDTASVAKKLEALALKNRASLRLVGDARKFVLDNTWTRVPESLALLGLQRPVYLRRVMYHDALNGLRETLGAAWEDLHVCGDHFELDLALPHVLGAHTHYVKRLKSPVYEVEAMASFFKKSSVCASLEALLDI
jgi:FMN phosphatase YigB (HAD superfamily)